MVIYFSGEDNYISRLDDKNLREGQKIATWERDGVQISTQTPIPQGQEVIVRISSYDPSKSSFIFPQGNYTFRTKVYMINISATDPLLVRGIQVRWLNCGLITRQRRDRLQVFQASCVPTHWEASRSAPLFSFSPIESRRVQFESHTIVLHPESPHCYLVIAGM